MITSFIIEIKNGEILWNSNHHKELYDRYIGQFRDGKYRLEINEMKEKRSDSQNRYYWLYLGIISRESGHTTEELHAYFKGKHLTKTITKVFGHDVRITGSTKKQSTGEFCEYLVNISIETGVELPDTTEFLGYSYHK